MHFKGIAEHIFKSIMKDMREIETNRYLESVCFSWLIMYLSGNVPVDKIFGSCYKRHWYLET